MDAYEATRIVFSRIQALDPENASKIMGLLLIQDHGEKEMIRLAFGPESLLHSVVFKARKDLGLSSASNGGLSISLSLSPTTAAATTTTTTTNNNNNNSHHHNHHNSSSSTTPTTPSSPSPFFPNPISRQNSISSSRILSNLSPSSPSSWAPPNFPDTTSAATSYDDLITINNHNLAQSDLMDEFQLHEQLSFLNEAGAAADSTIFPSSYPWGPISSGSHRRSNSVTDICGDPLGTGGLGWKPCLYFARGYCKNGTSCRFLHGLPDEGGLVGSPTTAMEQCHQELLLLRSATKTHQQQQQQPQQLRLGSNSSQLINSSSFPYPSGKCMDFLLQQQQQQQSDPQRAVSASAAVAAAALMLGEDVHKFGRLRIDRNEGMVNPGSRQIYLTFPADSTFREEDVSNYFSIYGPVQDVRIPYQQKRMFGFVTFVYPETVKLILAKGNPHFVCDARVLVKPYKEKGKVPDKYRKQQQQQQQQQSGGERGDFSGCSTPTGIDSRDPYDLQQLGGRAFNSTQEMLRRKLEEQQVDLQQAIELQSRRFMGLQLLDVKKHHHQRNLSAGAVPIPSPTHHHHHNHHHHHPLISPHFTNGNHVSIFSQSVGADPDRGASPEGPPPPPPPPPQDQQIKNPEEMVNHNDNGSKGNGNDSASIDDCGFHSSLEHNLPDSPFASPKKSNGDSPSSISVVGGSGEGERSNGIAIAGSSALSSSSSSFLPSSNSNKNLVAASSLLPATSSLDIAPFKSCLLQVPRFSSGHGALGM